MRGNDESGQTGWKALIGVRLLTLNDCVFRVDDIILRPALGATYAAAKVDIQCRAACEQEREHDEEPD